jgi:divalent metal cation (Fe/Co/Zn/Cd) transporter
LLASRRSPFDRDDIAHNLGLPQFNDERFVNRSAVLRRGLWLEYATLSWNVVGSVVVLGAAIAAHSVALAGFGLDSLIEILASTVVVWQLRGGGQDREGRALRIIGAAFFALAVYVTAQSTYTLATTSRPHHSPVGIVWLAATVAVMFALAAGKGHAGRALANPVLRTEARVTMIDAYLAVAVLAGLVLNAAAGWWWADPLAGFVIVFYGMREGWAALHHPPGP